MSCVLVYILSCACLYTWLFWIMVFYCDVHVYTMFMLSFHYSRQRVVCGARADLTLEGSARNGTM